jgi:hypothetical protein
MGTFPKTLQKQSVRLVPTTLSSPKSRVVLSGSVTRGGSIGWSENGSPATSVLPLVGPLLNKVADLCEDTLTDFNPRQAGAFRVPKPFLKSFKDRGGQICATQ